MRRSKAGIIMAAGFFALVAVAWLYLQDQQQVSSGAAAQAVAPGRSASVDQGGSAAESPGAAPSTRRPGTPTYVAEDEGAGGVNVMAAALTPGALETDPSLGDLAAQLDPATEVGFLIVFETHAGDLSKLDLVALSSLDSPDGEHRAIRWVGEDDSSHHRSGMLVFERGGLDLAAPGDLTLTVRDVADVPSRALTWLLPLQ
ncbi:MAG: hypothetical protein KKA32_01965 [Actinobacteria bacterium]|nr:hypothetical protein [Actinomycetota bacterium]